jgi:hypothetical protein
MRGGRHADEINDEWGAMLVTFMTALNLLLPRGACPEPAAAKWAPALNLLLPSGRLP